MKLKDKVAIITGSTQGIGRSMANRFAAEGAAVVVTGRNERNGAAVEREILDAGGRAAYIRTDVSVNDDVERMVTFALEQYGKMDVLVNNAATNIGSGFPFFKLPVDKWQEIIDVDLTGVFLCSRAVAPHMIEREQGAIINIASVFAFATSTGNAAYNAAKGGLLQLTRAMAVDLAVYSVRVNGIAPGAISLRENADFGAGGMCDYIPSRRWGAPQDIASVALFLCTEEAGYVNGETIVVDGGLLAVLPGKPIGTK